MKSLIIVDLQKDFYDPRGSMYVSGAEALPARVAAMLPEFDNVFFTLDWHPLDHCSFKEQGGPWPPHCVHHTAGASLSDCVLEGLEEHRMRFILKGRRPEREEYGAFVDVDPANQDLFQKGDCVVVCGIAAEYCVLETLKNLYAISEAVGFQVRVYLDGTARFESTDTVTAFMKEKGIKEYKPKKA